MFHGTEKERGQLMITTQKMIPSISDDNRIHWLGDGIYLYREIFYAFRWIVLMYNDHFGNNPQDEQLFENYSVLDVEIDYNPDRIFCLDNPEHYMVFKTTEMEYKKKSAFSSKLARYDYTDGIIINILFKNLNYGENYDAVEAVFPIFELDDTLTNQSRLKSINEYQICVKNGNIIKNISDVTSSIDYEKFYERYIGFERFKKGKGKKVSSSKYVNNQRGRKNGKW